MRVLLDYQACQTGSKDRGIGKATKALFREMARKLIDNGVEVIALLNSSIEDGLREVAAEIEEDNASVIVEYFRPIVPCQPCEAKNEWRQYASRAIRELKIMSLRCDWVHIPALLADGWIDNSVASIGLVDESTKTSVTQHDLVPLVFPHEYLALRDFRNYYMDKLDYLNRADILMAISHSSAMECIELLRIPEHKIRLVYSGSVASRTRPQRDTLECSLKLDSSIRHNGFLYLPGGFEPRKNLDRLIIAYSRLDDKTISERQLVIGSAIDTDTEIRLRKLAEEAGLHADRVVFTGYIPDNILGLFYSSCFCYVCPSLHEGFGLPVLEAMEWDKPVVCSRGGALEEIVDCEEALFDGLDVVDITRMLERVSSDNALRKRLIDNAKVRRECFSWEKTSEIATRAILEELEESRLGIGRERDREVFPSFDYVVDRVNWACPSQMKPSSQDLEYLEFIYSDLRKDYFK